MSLYNMFNIELKTGTLQIEADDNLKDLTGFGSRINKKRGFLFISKVLGKHMPSKPKLMEQMHSLLAKKLKEAINNKPTLVIGMAETATGLGFGVYEQLNIPESFYIHTTRYNLSSEVLLKFQEEHCHAPSHILYEIKDCKLKTLTNKLENIVLVDDEISTGKTAYNLICELKKIFPQVKNYYVASYLSWASDLSADNIYLSKGRFDFIPKDCLHDDNVISVTTNKDYLDNIIPYNFGRYGIQELNIDFSQYVNKNSLKDKKVLILGTGEFMYASFKLGSYLEEHGIDVYVQSTSRSPINIDNDIVSKISFKDNYYEDIDNFLYNVVDKDYDKVFICYETESIPQNHNLKQILNAYFNDVEELFIKPNN